MTDNNDPNEELENDALDQAAKEQDEKVEAQKNRLIDQIKIVFAETVQFLRQLLSIREETDYKKTREGIERDVTFRGHTVYILICSIFIASIGLNLNSPAVIIGAMLIAPLMGPIIGIGLALGTNDFTLLMKSLKNFGVMVGISIVTSTVYFYITPLVEYQSEILARVKPTTLDIFVAIFGGIAGIVAGSRKEKSNVIPGVAIATALMPPLCTAGFGLANANWNFFFGAFYLFLLNSIFICAATLVGVRYLRFPLRVFVNPKKEKRTRAFMVAFILIMVLPSLWIFWGVLQESFFNRNADSFIRKEVHINGAKLVNQKLFYNDTVPSIELYLIGVQIPDDTVALWRRKLQNYGLNHVALEVYGNTNGDDDDAEELNLLSGQIQQNLKEDLLKDLYVTNQKLLEDKDERITYLEDRLFKEEIRFREWKMVGEELKIQFENLEKISFAESVESDFSGNLDTIPTFIIKWDPRSPSKQCRKEEETIAKLMKLRFDLDTVRVITTKK